MASLGISNFNMKKKKLNLRDIKPNSEKEHSHDDGHNHSKGSNNFKAYSPAIVSFVMLIIGITLDYFDINFFRNWIRVVWYIVAYIPVGFPVVKEGWKSIKKGDVYNGVLLEKRIEDKSDPEAADLTNIYQNNGYLAA